MPLDWDELSPRQRLEFSERMFGPCCSKPKPVRNRAGVYCVECKRALDERGPAPTELDDHYDPWRQPR